jgi:hypothetical protein
MASGRPHPGTGGTTISRATQSIATLICSVLYDSYSFLHLNKVTEVVLPEHTREAAFQLFCDIRSNTPKDVNFLKRHARELQPRTFTGYLALSSSLLYLLALGAFSSVGLVLAFAALSFGSIFVAIFGGVVISLLLAATSMALAFAAVLTALVASSLGTASAASYLIISFWRNVFHVAATQSKEGSPLRSRATAVIKHAEARLSPVIKEAEARLSPSKYHSGSPVAPATPAATAHKSASALDAFATESGHPSASSATESSTGSATRYEPVPNQDLDMERSAPSATGSQTDNDTAGSKGVTNFTAEFTAGSKGETAGFNQGLTANLPPPPSEPAVALEMPLGGPLAEPLSPSMPLTALAPPSHSLHGNHRPKHPLPGQAFEA